MLVSLLHLTVLYRRSLEYSVIDDIEDEIPKEEHLRMTHSLYTALIDALSDSYSTNLLNWLKGETTLSPVPMRDC